MRRLDRRDAGNGPAGGVRASVRVAVAMRRSP